MRIVAGEFRGRRLTAPKGDTTRPTTDRVREALFSAMTSIAGPDLGGGAALDLFAGSGALGLEALSRGSQSATLVDKDRAALAAIRANVEALGVAARVRVVSGNAEQLALRGALPGGPFALLLLDPPYRLDGGSVGRLLEALAGHDLLVVGALVVYEHARGVSLAWPAGFDETSAKRYGDTEAQIAIFRKGTGSK